MEFFRNPSFNFVGGMKGAFMVSTVLVALSLIAGQPVGQAVWRNGRQVF